MAQQDFLKAPFIGIMYRCILHICAAGGIFRENDCAEFRRLIMRKRLAFSAMSLVLLVIAGCSLSPAGEKPVINNFTADPPSVSYGGGTTLSWHVTNATSVDIDHGIGVAARASGSTVAYPGSTTSYRITATNAAGSNSAIVTVAVGGSSPVSPGPSPQPAGTGIQPPLVYNFWADPSTLAKGSSTKLSWNVMGAYSVRIDPTVGIVKTTGSVNVTPSSSTTYTLTASNSGGNVRAMEEVHVLQATPSLPAINWFAASPSSILSGNSATLSWSTTNAKLVSISGIGSVAASGSRKVAPRSTTQYILEAISASGRFQDAVMVEVYTLSPSVYYQTYQVQPDYIPPLVPVLPDYGPGGGGYSGAGGDTPGGGGYSGADGNTPGGGGSSGAGGGEPPDEDY
jgi:uncharacterized membrane protein YgcG